MPPLRALGRFVSLWFALSLVLAGLVMPVASPVVGVLNAPIANGVVSAGVAAVALVSVPEVRPEAVWTLGLLTLLGFGVGRWVAGRVGLAPESVGVSVLAWVVAFGLAVAVLASRGIAWTDADVDT
ncbi:hypothetical protein J2752_000598 [Halarchaeum rubridurum]|uniref:Uncharacterized protein n=1 Tax=Halarchaeum rubridurum TaxID=489911 RepID=A0A830FXQ8_9EURY|nr:hypothetical protein [Halarchaeum rubridurum]MBP1953717.1 hypothetical protein [Halarchaeum rubridurum]GGM54101.1 hypothetical protein GCM10009017_00580 [Halarchaeum rubridurum]